MSPSCYRVWCSLPPSTLDSTCNFFSHCDAINTVKASRLILWSCFTTNYLTDGQENCRYTYMYTFVCSRTEACSICLTTVECDRKPILVLTVHVSWPWACSILLLVCYIIINLYAYHCNRSGHLDNAAMLRTVDSHFLKLRFGWNRYLVIEQ